jgi:hypothetical protein
MNNINEVDEIKEIRMNEPTYIFFDLENISDFKLFNKFKFENVNM